MSSTGEPISTCVGGGTDCLIASLPASFLPLCRVFVKQLLNHDEASVSNLLLIKTSRRPQSRELSAKKCLPPKLRGSQVEAPSETICEPLVDMQPLNRTVQITLCPRWLARGRKLSGATSLVFREIWSRACVELRGLVQKSYAKSWQQRTQSTATLIC